MSTTPEQKRLPRQLDPRKFAQKGVELEGDVPLNDMPRLAQLALNVDGSAYAKLEFGVDEQRFRTIQGNVSVALDVPCQRCLESTTVQIESKINLAVVWDEEAAKNLPKRFDPLILEDGVTDIYVVVEDEILLNVPMVAYHEHKCLSKTSFGDAEVEEDLEEKNPFQVLEQLKGSPKS